MISFLLSVSILSAQTMKKSLALPVIVSGFLLSGCSTILENLPGVYSLDVQQGNVINQAMIDQLRPNMTKRQVLYIMGSSMLVDVFHQNRWDYLYSEQPGGGDRVQKRLSLYFKDDILMGVQGDFRPSTLPVIVENNETTIDLPKRNLEKTMWEKITSIFGDEPDLIAVNEREQDQKQKSEEKEKVFDDSF
jgi:outer membrane protein assembly factor BamE